MSPIRVVFFGTPAFAVIGLKALIESPRFDVALVVTQPDRPAGRSGRLAASPVKEFAAPLGIPIQQPERIKRDLPGFLNAASPFGPFDIGVVIAFGQILPKAVLDVPKLGCINVHASLLPRWRGAAPIHRAILSGDSETGVCLMQMDTTLDTGAVFAHESTPIHPNDTTGSLHDRLAAIGAKLLIQHLPSIASQSLHAHPQPTEGVSYAEKITNEEAEIDWHDTAQNISRKIRALNPAPGAFTWCGETRLKIYEAVPHARRAGTNRAPPGTVTLFERGLFEVETGEGVLALTSVQLAGKRRMTTEEFSRGAPCAAGDRLGKEQ